MDLCPYLGKHRNTQRKTAKVTSGRITHSQNQVETQVTKPPVKTSGSQFYHTQGTQQQIQPSQNSQ